MTTIAITGAGGFIGRHVAADLARRGLAPLVISRAPDRLPPEIARFRVVRADIRSITPADITAIGSPEILIHLAWGGLPNYRSLHHFETELPAHYMFLKAMVANGVRRIVVAGTCFEYGMQSGELHEGLPSLPGNPYGHAKDALRQQLGHLKVNAPFGLTWARLFYLYGQGQPATSLWPQLQASAARGDRVFRMSGGAQLRDYLPVGDAARYIVDLALQDRDHGIVNVCSGVPVSVRALVEEWMRRNNWTMELDLGAFPYPDYEPMAFWGARRKLDSLLT